MKPLLFALCTAFGFLQSKRSAACVAALTGTYEVSLILKHRGRSASA